MSAPALVPPTARPRAVSNWLLTLCALIFVMVVVGGITRLTESGLSITEWKPITGAIPPLTQAQWQHQFELYQRIPEYQQLNRGMTLDEFKNIFFWEWAHRQLGRVIGLVALLPLVWFAAKKAIPRGYGWRTGIIFLLVCVQGAIGWWMVASGLTERTDVSHVRLAVHLLTALVILSFTLWTALDLRSEGAVPRKVPTLGLWAFAALFVQLLFGAYVAGLDAGYAFDTWPLMGDELYPAAAPWLEPFVRNFVDNPVTVQFVHRWWAWVVLVFAVVLARKVRPSSRRHSIALHSAIGAQILLGIWTLLSGVKLHVAVAHQATAVLVVASFVAAIHRLAVPGRVTERAAPLVPSTAEGL
ncbi:heme A synthase [Sphingomonas astaxanthinifaciens]